VAPDVPIRCLAGSIYNHITVRSGEDPASGAPHFLINPFGLDFSEVTASSLLKVDLEGTVVDAGSTDFTFNLAGFVIHSAVHERRPDLRCVIHSHHRAVVAVASTVHGLLPCSLEACKLAPLVSVWETALDFPSSFSSYDCPEHILTNQPVP
jgi:ribulose-5-phosphate 4-epimerase/fuculose-1-phosphate aldolase